MNAMLLLDLYKNGILLICQLYLTFYRYKRLLQNAPIAFELVTCVPEKTCFKYIISVFKVYKLHPNVRTLLLRLYVASVTFFMLCSTKFDYWSNDFH